MIKKLLKIRYLFLVAVIFTLLNSVVFLAAGVYESIIGYTLFLKHGISEEHRPGVYILKGLDMFLVSMVFMIFALGIIRIFTHYDQEDERLPGWLNFDTFKELKVLLWETIIVTLVVFAFTELVSSRQVLSWNSLIMPAIIVALTTGLLLMKRLDKH